jgi:hypothetical protein
MPISESFRAVAAAAILMLLAGCSAGTINAPPATNAQLVAHSGFRADVLLSNPNVAKLVTAGSPHWIKRPAKPLFKGDVWTTDASDSTLIEVNPAGKIIKTIKTVNGFSEPQGVAADAKGNIYVTDSANARVVVVNGRTGKVVAILSDPGQYPASVAVNNEGVIGVSNIISASGSAGSISFYSSLKATSPTSSSTGLLSRDYFIGCDAEGNFYIDGIDAQTGAIDVGVTTDSSGTIINTGIETSSWGFPGGVNVYVASRKSGEKSSSEVLGVGDQTDDVVYQFSLPNYKAGKTVYLAAGGSNVDEVGYSLDVNDKVAGAPISDDGSLDFWKWPEGGSSPIGTIGGVGSELIGIVFARPGVE